VFDAPHRRAYSIRNVLPEAIGAGSDLRPDIQHPMRSFTRRRTLNIERCRTSRPGQGDVEIDLRKARDGSRMRVAGHRSGAGQERGNASSVSQPTRDRAARALVLQRAARSR